VVDKNFMIKLSKNKISLDLLVRFASRQNEQKKSIKKLLPKAPFHYPKPTVTFHSFPTLVFPIGIKNSATGVKRCCSHLRLRCTSAQVFPASPLLRSQRPRIAFLTSGFRFAGLPARN